MKTMTKEEQEAKMAEFKKAPKFLQLSAMLSFLLGFITLIRMPMGAYANHLSVGRAVLSGLILFACFFFNGASLYSRNRWGYIGLIVFGMLPMLGLLGWSLHLFRITLEGTLSESWPVTIHCAICNVQLVVTVILLGFLLTGQVRNYVCKSHPQGQPQPDVVVSKDNVS